MISKWHKHICIAINICQTLLENSNSNSLDNLKLVTHVTTLWKQYVWWLRRLYAWSRQLQSSYKWMIKESIIDTTAERMQSLETVSDKQQFFVTRTKILSNDVSKLCPGMKSAWHHSLGLNSWYIGVLLGRVCLSVVFYIYSGDQIDALGLPMNYMLLKAPKITITDKMHRGNWSSK